MAPPFVRRTATCFRCSRSSATMSIARNPGCKLMAAATHPAVVHYALEPNAVEVREVAVPTIGDNDVLLEVGAVSVCGSDVHQARNTHSWPVNVPVVLGHEFGGSVTRVGRTVRGFREGDRVVSETAARICGECLLCDRKSTRL